MYPIACMGAGDTFGYTTVGTTGYLAVDANYAFCAGMWSPASDGTLDDIQAWLRVDTDVAYTFGVWDESGSEANNLIAVTAGGNVGTGTDWRQQSLGSENILAATSYFLGFCHSSGDTSRWYYDSNSGFDNGFDGLDSFTYSAGSLPNPFDWSGWNTSRNYSIYCNYTVAAGGVERDIAGSLPAMSGALSRKHYAKRSMQGAI